MAKVMKGEEARNGRIVNKDSKESEMEVTKYVESRVEQSSVEESHSSAYCLDEN